MQVFVPREARSDERRVALVPESVNKLVKAGISVAMERGAGEGSFIGDKEFESAGAVLARDRADLSKADLVLKVNPPSLEDVAAMRPGAMVLAPLTPTRNLALVRALAYCHWLDAFPPLRSFEVLTQSGFPTA